MQKKKCYRRSELTEDLSNIRLYVSNIYRILNFL